MKNCKRLSCLAAAVLLCLMLACPAYAVDLQAVYPTIAEVDIFPLDTEGYIGNFWALNGSSREIKLTGTMRIGPTIMNQRTLNTNVHSFDWAGNGRYNWQSEDFSSNSSSVLFSINSGAYVDIYGTEVFPASDGAEVILTGDVRFFVIPTGLYSVNNGSDVGNLEQYAVYPSSCAVISNDIVYDSFTGSNGSFTVDSAISNSDPVTKLGFRFYFDSFNNNYELDSPSSSKSVLFAFYDNTSTEVNDPNGTDGLLQTVISEVKALPSTIYNFFFGESGGDDAAGFKSEVDSAVSSVDQVQQEIVEGLDKPEPDQIVPDISGIVSDEDYSGFTDVFASVLRTGSMIADMMLAVCALAMLSYVLFGKKG